MVAYSFQAEFEAPLRAGTKQGTIRPHRKRHARVGEQVQLYRGLRTRHCRLLGTATARHVRPIRLDLDIDVVLIGDGLVAYAADAELDHFARRDGFEGWAALKAFWAKHHPGRLSFSGVQVFWADTFEAAS